jgi:hypothetical protein
LRRGSPSDTRTFLVLEGGLAWERFRNLHPKFRERPFHALGRMRTAKGLLVPDRLRAALLACGGRTRT